MIEWRGAGGTAQKISVWIFVDILTKYCSILCPALAGNKRGGELLYVSAQGDVHDVQLKRWAFSSPPPASLTSAAAASGT